MSQTVQPLVSVVVPAYNHEDFVRDALQSCIDQTYRDLEIIIVNDGSKDNTGKICKELAASDTRIRYFEQPNQGAHVAINEGIRKAVGDYLAILNSDDIFDSRKIERCVHLIQQKPDLALICGKVELIDQKGHRLRRGIEVDWLKRAYDFLERSGLFPLSVLNENFIATTSNMFFTKELWNNVGRFQPLRYCHDLDFLIASFRIAPFLFDRHNVHIQYRIHPSNTIKEDLSKIRLEIAAVISASLCDYNVDFVRQMDEKNITLFKEFLENKMLSDLIIFLMMLYLGFSGRQEFYERLKEKELIEPLYNLLSPKH